MDPPSKHPGGIGARLFQRATQLHGPSLGDKTPTATPTHLCHAVGRAGLQQIATTTERVVLIGTERDPGSSQ